MLHVLNASNVNHSIPLYGISKMNITEIWSNVKTCIGVVHHTVTLDVCIINMLKYVKGKCLEIK